MPAQYHDDWCHALQAVEAVAEAGKCCILDIDVQGARQVIADFSSLLSHHLLLSLLCPSVKYSQYTTWRGVQWTCLAMAACWQAQGSGILKVLHALLQVRKSKLKAIFVFVAPPSTEALEQRLHGRNTETPEQIAERMAAAREEIAT